MATSPLEEAKLERLHRQIRNEDLKMAVAESKLIRADVHRKALSEFVNVVITFFDTLPDVLERKLALDPVVVDELRRTVDQARDSLHEKLVEIDYEDEASPTPKRGRPNNAERAVRAKKERKVVAKTS
jgi:hypothetical protein